MADARARLESLIDETDRLIGNEHMAAISWPGRASSDIAIRSLRKLRAQLVEELDDCRSRNRLPQPDEGNDE